MNKEPIGLYIFRFVLGFGLFAFMCMLYWSSLLIEQNVRSLQDDVKALKGEVESLRLQASKASVQTSLPPAHATTTALPNNSSASNILQEDPFYQKTLPNLLGSHFTPQGTFHFDVTGKPDNLHPFSNWSEVATWTNQCQVSVSRLQFGKYETFAPDAAIKMEERFNPETTTVDYWIYLRPGMVWQPLRKEMFSEDIALAPHFLKKHPVTAYDFKFYYDALMNPNNQEPGAVSARTYWGDIQSLEVVDDLTFIVKWKTHEIEQDGKKVRKAKYIAKGLTGGIRPLPSFLYQYFSDGNKIIEDDKSPDTYRTSFVWAQNFSQHWAKNIIPSCGPWIFEGMTDRQISFRRNPDYYFPLDVLVEASVSEFKDSPDAPWQDFKSNKIDTYNLRPDQILEFEQFLKSGIYKSQASQGQGIKRIDYLARQYTYVGWNQVKPFFKSKKVRQALAMAIDRRRIIRGYLNGMGEEITGPFFKHSPSYDQSIVPWPFDLEKARRLLEEEGWYDSNGDGIIDKQIDGKRQDFRFGLTYYVKNTISKSICEYISTALKEVGIICNLNGVDIADLSAAFDDKSFDAIYLGWALGTPPEDPRQLWYSTGATEKGSSNAIGFANATADKLIDALTYEYNIDKRNELYHQFHRLLHEEQPYLFVYSPKTALLYREYVQNVFIPAERQDLVPGANIAEPESSIFWLKS